MFPLVKADVNDWNSLCARVSNILSYPYVIFFSQGASWLQTKKAPRRVAWSYNIRRNRREFTRCTQKNITSWVQSFLLICIQATTGVD